MSLLSREQVIVGLAPEQLSAVRLSGRWRARLLERHASPVPAGGGLPWTGCIEALEILLDDPAWGSRDITAILSEHYVHYVVLPKGEPLPPAEQQVVASLVFRDLYGELAHDWELRVSSDGQRPTLASGIPAPLLETLRTVCAGRGALRSIQPLLMAVANGSRPVLDKLSGILALVESGRITLAVLAAGQWSSVSSRAASGDALPDLLAETEALSGTPAGGRLWLCDLSGRATPPAGAAWQLERLERDRAGAASLAGWGIP